MLSATVMSRSFFSTATSTHGSFMFMRAAESATFSASTGTYVMRRSLAWATAPPPAPPSAEYSELDAREYASAR